ncbi:MAG: NAD(P)H-binding protein [Solirubrobacterales bacterium]|nr:NAD(P)H-binding protein [Solirubrobacterales bacterium]
MRVAIAGAHGQIAQALTKQLVARGDSVLGLIRNPDHIAEIRALGAEPVLCDLEHATVDALSAAIKGADAAVFAAGAGPGSGADRKLTVDRDGAIKLLEAGPARFVIVSSVGAQDPPSDDQVFSVYLRAKAAADAAVQASDRNWTIIRPGRLTDDPRTGKVRIDHEPSRGEISRADVAAVISAVLADPRTVSQTLYVNSGTEPLATALG